VTLGITAPYWIVRLGKDYEYSVVSDSKYKYLWILSRKPHMSEFLYNELIEDLDKNGFPVNKLEKTLQDQPEEKLTEDKEEESL
jgi:apolipoprotein D and lipocalin family protein